MFMIKIADVWIQTWVLWWQKLPLCHLCHAVANFLSSIELSYVQMASIGT